MLVKGIQDETYYLTALRAGEDHALVYYFDLHYKSLCYFADRLLLDFNEAEEIVSDCFCKLWERKTDFYSSTNIKAFLFISCRNACYNHLKKIKRITDQQIEYVRQLEEGEETILYEMIETEILDILSQEIEELPDKCGEVFKLIFFHGRKTDEIALQLGLSAQTVRNHKTRAIQLLKTSLLKKGVSSAIFLAFLLLINK